MFQQYSNQIRRTAIVAATALTVALPGAADAGLLNKAKSQARQAASKASNVVSIVRERKPVRNAIQNALPEAPGADLFEMVGELQITQQLRETLELLRQIQSEYRTFSGGSGCNARCQTFRTDLKGLFADFMFVVEDAPVVQNRAGLVDNIERLSNLIDYVPPRALYLMWQAMRDQIDGVRGTMETVRVALQELPDFMKVQQVSATLADSRACAWVNQKDKPVVEWLQAEMEGLAWSLKTIEGFIPDVKVKGDVGASAGAAVANGEAAAGVGVKITDTLKIGLKVAATVPEGINMGIKVRMARMKLLCAGANYLSN
jgi:hypothetical protein